MRTEIISIFIVKGFRMNYKYYAKSKPIETIKEHTDKLLENLEILKRKILKQKIKISQFYIGQVTYHLKLKTH